MNYSARPFLHAFGQPDIFFTSKVWEFANLFFYTNTVGVFWWSIDDRNNMIYQDIYNIQVIYSYKMSGYHYFYE